MNSNSIFDNFNDKKFLIGFATSIIIAAGSIYYIFKLIMTNPNPINNSNGQTQVSILNKYI